MFIFITDCLSKSFFSDTKSAQDPTVQKDISLSLEWWKFCD